MPPRTTIISLVLILQTMKLGQSLLQPLSGQQKDLRHSLTLCVIEACQKFFTEGEAITYSLPVRDIDPSFQPPVPLDSILIPALELEGKWPLLLENVSEQVFYQKTVKPDNYIIQIRSPEDFFENIDFSKKHIGWNPHAKFLVISSTVFNNTMSLAVHILEKLWKENVVDAVVLLANSLNDTTFNAFTWFPYDEGNCGTDFKNTYIIDSCKFGNHSNNASWFGNKIPRKFNECTLEVRAVEYPPYVLNTMNNSMGTMNRYYDYKGLEINLLNLLAEIFNVKMRYTFSDEPLDWGEVYPNGTVTGNLLPLADDQVDIAVGSYGESFFIFEDSTSYFQETLQWCVPHNPAVREWETLTDIISSDAWILTFIVFMFSTFLFWLIGKYDSSELAAYKTFLGSFQHSYAILIGVATLHLPITRFGRFTAALLILYSFYLVTTYQTLLMSSLADYRYTEEIQNIMDIYDNELKTYFLPNFRRYFHLNDSKYMQLIVNHWNDCYDAELCLSYVAVDRDSAMAVPKLYKEYVWNSYMTPKGEPLLYCFESTIIGYPVHFLMRKGFPLYAQINLMINRILSAGFVLKWEKDIVHNRLTNMTYFEVDISMGQNGEVLGLLSMEPVFLMLVIGYALGVIMLFLEIGYKKWGRN